LGPEASPPQLEANAINATTNHVLTIAQGYC
jgi:hypothetical protein